MAKVSVVIPFYQRREGILRAGVLSVLHQKTSALIQVIVVDDGSPVSARSELGDLLDQHPGKIVIVEQKNAGAGAARSTGLETVSSDTDYVAFLDSDDAWIDSHIENAVCALDNGYDLYFADFYQLNQNVTAFNRGGRIRVEDHPSIHPVKPLREFTGDMFDQILQGNILGTSVIVYNFRKFRHLRYPSDFRHTGEEYIFWIHLALGSEKIAFSSIPECHYGPGVNIFSEPAWGTDKYLTVLHDLIKYKKYVLNQFVLTDSQRTSLTQGIRTHRMDYARGLLHNLIQNRRVNLRIIWKQLRLDPQTLATLAVVPGVRAYERLRRIS